MAITYEPIATVTSTSTTISFSSIPATYTDLKLVVNAVLSSGATSFIVRLNGDNGSNYCRENLNAISAAVTATNGVSATSISMGTTSGIAISPVFFDIDIIQYAGSNFKNMLIKKAQAVNNTSNTSAELITGAWLSTTAVNAITITAGNTLGTGTTATLYGIKAA